MGILLSKLHMQSDIVWTATVQDIPTKAHPFHALWTLQNDEMTAATPRQQPFLEMKFKIR